MGKLTTHVLDTAHGKPGAGIAVALYRMNGYEREFVAGHTTNADGRCDQPLLDGMAIQTGVYELDFAIGDYFARMGVKMAEPRFIDVVVVRFGINDAKAHYHVPLLASPYGYSTYRGS
ncbi:MAG: hydroxyisourate hydrolase [Xanthomonadales bacterium]|nr:hydroxyisourate hydrolase [Xanthomonadales bacterium]MBK7143841.1 hydroxyisourate hydrolase [Xanthomonadales bacterium]